MGCLVTAEWRQRRRSSHRILSEADAWLLHEDLADFVSVVSQSGSQRRKKDRPSGAWRLYVRILRQSWVVCPVSQEMIFAYFRPLMVMVVVKMTARPGWGSLSAEMPGDRITSAKLHIDKAGGGGVAVAPTGSMMWKWSCYKMTH